MKSALRKVNIWGNKKSEKEVMALAETEGMQELSFQLNPPVDLEIREGRYWMIFTLFF